MKRFLFVIVWATAPSLAAFSPAGGAAAQGGTSPGWTHIVMRVYDAAPVPTGAWTDAVAAADAILLQAAIRVEWRRCGAINEAAPDTACRLPLEANEFALRLVPGHIPGGQDAYLPLGYSLIDTQTGTGSLATIHPDRVAWLAGRSGVDLRTLLGRTIAHEVGHLLLGTNDHRPLGLMRAVWSQEVLHRNVAADWIFTGADASDMRAAFRSRLARQQLAIRTPNSQPPIPSVRP